MIPAYLIDLHTAMTDDHALSQLRTCAINPSHTTRYVEAVRREYPGLDVALVTRAIETGYPTPFHAALAGALETYPTRELLTPALFSVYQAAGRMVRVATSGTLVVVEDTDPDGLVAVLERTEAGWIMTEPRDLTPDELPEIVDLLAMIADPEIGV